MTIKLHSFRLGAWRVHKQSKRIDARIIHHRVRFSIDFSLEQHLVPLANHEMDGVICRVDIILIIVVNDFGGVNQQPDRSAGSHGHRHRKHDQIFQ